MEPLVKKARTAGIGEASSLELRVRTMEDGKSRVYEQYFMFFPICSGVCSYRYKICLFDLLMLVSSLYSGL